MSRKQQGVVLWGTVSVMAAGFVLLLLELIKGGASLRQLTGVFFGSVIPTVGFAYTLLMQYSMRFYLFVSRLRSLAWADAPSWNLSATFEGDDILPEKIDQVTQVLVARYKDRVVKSRRIAPMTREVVIPRGPNLEVHYNQPVSFGVAEGKASIQVRITNYHVGYRETKRALEVHILPVLEAVGKALGGTSHRYSLTIEFDKGKNPFFGLVVAQLPPEAVSRFVVNLSPDPKSGESVLISEMKLAINTRSQHTLRDRALEFLTFQPKLSARMGHG